MTDCLQIIASALFNALVGGDRGVSGGSSKILTVLVRNMLALTVFVALGKAEVDDVDVVSGGLGAADQEVIRLDVTMDDSLLMHFLDSLDELRADQQDSFQVELPAACLEKVFEGWTKQVHDHDMKVLVGNGAVCADVVKAGNAS